MTRDQLRTCARTALEQRGYSASIHVVPRAASGARLIAVKGENRLTVAVRTSMKREAGFMRSPDGGWKTISNVDWVVVAVPSRSRGKVDVYFFTSSELISFFEKCLSVHKHTLNSKSPVFVALDEKPTKKFACVGYGLTKIAFDEEHLTLHKTSAVGDDEVWDTFVDRVTREAASLLGRRVDRVLLKFEILAKPSQT